MSLTLWVFLGIGAVALIWGVTTYNRLVALKHGVDMAWSNIDVLLKQRHDELPKLVEVCKQYKQFEQQTLQQVVEARSRVQAAREAQNVAALGQAEDVLRLGLGQIFAIAEAYPELRANENFAQLMARISQLENAITDRRELYNDAVNLHNVRIEQFPDALIAGLFRFGARSLLKFAESETKDVDLKQLFG